jgi:hypothetical protein
MTSRTTIPLTEEIHRRILTSSIFRIDGPDIDLTEELLALAKAILAEDDTDWSIGEYTEASLDSLVIGAYWSLSEWYSGQGSLEYQALCQLGRIFKPGMTCAPTPEDSEYTAYELIGEYYSKKFSR